MSIALEAKVAELEQRVVRVEAERDAALMAVDLIGQRVNAIEERVKVLIELGGSRGKRNG